MSAHCRRGHFAFEHGAPCHHLWAGKFKSSVILCDMKQVCELSEDAARRVMSSTCSVSTSRSLAGLGRSSGQCGHPSLHSAHPRTLWQPEHRSTQQGTATQSPTAQPIRKLSPTALLHTFASARRSVFRESREIFFRNLFRAACAVLAGVQGGPGGRRSVNTSPRFHLLRGRPLLEEAAA